MGSAPGEAHRGKAWAWAPGPETGGVAGKASFLPLPPEAAGRPRMALVRLRQNRGALAKWQLAKQPLALLGEREREKKKRERRRAAGQGLSGETSSPGLNFPCLPGSLPTF